MVERKLFFGEFVFIISISFFFFNLKINNFELLFFKGEQLGQTEATETFFAMTKLFQSKDVC